MMLTRCPGCSTTFRLTPEQVKARHGQVRCGRCQHIFDAIEHLLDAQLEVSPVSPATTKPATIAVADPVAGKQEEQAEVSLAPLDDDADLTETLATPGAALTPSTEDVASAAPAEESEPVVTAMLKESTATEIATETEHASDDTYSAATSADHPIDEALTADAAATPAHHALPQSSSDDILLQPSPLSSDYAASQAQQGPRWPWLIGVTCALIALIIQALLTFRVDLAAQYPAQRPLLEMLCAQFNCEVSLPSNPELISIEGSDLHPAHKSGLELTATLRNRATHAQSWPYLELTLTDGADKPIVRKVIEPLQYLPVSQAVEDGFAANGELGIQLQLDVGTLPAAGYRLYLFYP
jgi:predicted Zn finger-like uncharacterized protein